VLERVRVLLVSGEAPERNPIRSKLRDHINDFEIVGDALSTEEALHEVNIREPDVVMLDVQLPDADHLQVTRRLRQLSPTTSVIHLTSTPHDDELFGAIRYGAAAYLPKTIDSDELAGVIQRVRAGSYVIDDSVLANPALATRVLSAFRELTAMNQQVEPLFAPLSPREKEVLEHAGKGRSNREIARAMNISEQTVKNHLTSVMRKLAVNDRTHAVVYALQQGWINVQPL
jgi:RNA polymerase sigma factor (sigma-70 family)